MIRLSYRFAPQVVALLLLPLFPVVIHSYSRFRSQDCADMESVLSLAGPRREQPARDEWMSSQFAAAKWREGSLPAGSGSRQFKTDVIVSYDAKKLYHHPETALIRGASADSRATEWIEAGESSIPIHRAYYTAGDPLTVAGYLLVYNSQPVANPYVAQFAALGTQLFRGRAPMTMFFISARGPAGEAEAMEREVRQWLAGAWRQYKAACPG